MHRQDKLMVRNWAERVDMVANHLREAAERSRDWELKRFLDTEAGELSYVTTDLRDTVDRL